MFVDNKEKSYDYLNNSNITSTILLKSTLVVSLEKTIPKRLDNLAYSRFHTYLITALGTTWVLDGYEVALLSTLTGVIKNTFLMNDFEIRLAIKLYLTGCVCGSLLFGYLSNKHGRKFLFNITLGIYLISIILTALSFNKYMLYFSRILTGLSVGGEYSSMFASIDELIPPKVRGRVDLIIDGTWHLGSTIASILGFVFLTYVNINENYSMRILFAFGLIFAFPVILMRQRIPESPRWLLYRGKYKDALIVTESIEKACGRNDFSIYQDDKDQEYNSLLFKKSAYSFENQIKKEVSLKEIFIFMFVHHKKRFFYALILMASQALFYNGIFYTYVLNLQNFYFIPQETAGLYLIPLSLASFLGPILLGRFFDSWSRKKMIALTFELSGLFLILTALNFWLDFFNFYIQQVLWFVTFTLASPAASSAHLTVSEIFLLEIRSQAMAIFFSLGLLIGGVLTPFICENLILTEDKISVFYSYIICASIMIITGIFCFFFGINAENKSLEQISANIRSETFAESSLNEKEETI